MAVIHERRKWVGTIRGQLTQGKYTIEALERRSANRTADPIFTPEEIVQLDTVKAIFSAKIAEKTV